MSASRLIRGREAADLSLKTANRSPAKLKENVFNDG